MKKTEEEEMADERCVCVSVFLEDQKGNDYMDGTPNNYGFLGNSCFGYSKSISYTIAF